jgi:hypothetical protein
MRPLPSAMLPLLSNLSTPVLHLSLLADNVRKEYILWLGDGTLSCICLGSQILLEALAL